MPLADDVVNASYTGRASGASLSASAGAVLGTCLLWTRSDATAYDLGRRALWWWFGITILGELTIAPPVAL
jgi:hypothetical protein